MNMQSDSIDLGSLLSEHTWLRSLAFRLAGPDAADDVLQQAWIAHRTRAGSVRNPGAWMARVVTNFAKRYRRDRTRRARHEREHAVTRDGEALPAGELVAQMEQQQRVAAAVLALPEPFRGTVLAHFLEGRSTKEIAERTGQPWATVRSQLSRGLQMLREDLEADGAQWRDRLALAVFGVPSARLAKSPVATVPAVMAAVLLLSVAVAVPLVWRLLETDTPMPVMRSDASIGNDNDMGQRTADGGAGLGGRHNEPAREPVARMVKVRVEDVTGTSLSGAAIYSLEKDARSIQTADQPIAMTGQSGESLVPAQKIEGRLLAVNHLGHRVAGVAIADSAESHYAITLSHASTVEFEFKDLQGGPVRGIHVFLFQAAISFGMGDATAAATPLDLGRRGVACGVTDRDGRLTLSGLKAEPYWIHWSNIDWAEVSGPDGRIELSEGATKCQVVLARVMAVVGPQDVLTLGGDLPGGMSSSEPASIQGAVQIAQWRLKQRYPQSRSIVAVEQVVGAGAAPLKVAGWMSQGLRFESWVQMARISDAMMFAVEAQAGSGPGAKTVRVDLLSSDDVLLPGVDLTLQGEVGGKAVYLRCMTGKEVTVPLATYQVTLGGWGVVGEIAAGGDAGEPSVIRLPLVARVVRTTVKLPGGDRPMFAIENCGSRLSSFYGGIRTSVLTAGTHELEFQVPGWKPMRVRVDVVGSERGVLDAEAALGWETQ